LPTFSEASGDHILVEKLTPGGQPYQYQAGTGTKVATLEAIQRCDASGAPILVAPEKLTAALEMGR
jgi:hypothetical protein